MKRLLALILVLVAFTVSAQTQTTGNLITGAPTGTVPYTGTGAGFSGGNVPGYNATNNTIYFGYTNATVGHTIAINQALSGSGVQVNGMNYGFEYRNEAYAGGTLSATAALTSNTGATLQSWTHALPYGQAGWQTFSAQQTFNPYNLSSLGNASISFTGRDNRFWAGYYGPQVRNVNMSLAYTVDPCVANPQSDPSCPGYKTFYNISDDGYARVNLPFTFPFYGRNFTTSYMFSNGVVGFLDPTNSFCCDGVDLRSNPGSPWHFSIYALNTDLIAANPAARFYTQSDPTYMKYTWENINEFGTNNLNTFSATIKPSGFIGLKYDAVNITQHNVTIGTAGDLSQGQLSQVYNGPGTGLAALNLTTPDANTGYKFTFSGTEVDQCFLNPLSNTSCPGYQAAMCQTNPLFNPGCPGYAQAYFQQQCSADALYNPGCPGYAQAYHDRQCSINPLYATDCPGYTVAYHDQQCSINPLYATDCVNYTTAKAQCDANPLSNSYCPGYDTALTTCSINPLSNALCSGYTAATASCSANPLSYSYCPSYQTATAQCSANALTYSYCPGYQSTLQYCSTDPLSNSMCPTYSQSLSTCTANPLSNSYCPGYTTAVTQCSANALNYSYCPGYQTALNTCSTNPLSNSLCSGYQTATNECNSNPLIRTYCPAYNTTLASCATNPTSNAMCPGYASAMTASTTTTTTSTTATTTTGSSDPTATTSSAVTAVTGVTTAPTPVQSPIQSALTPPSTTSATSPTSVTSVIAPPQSVGGPGPGPTGSSAQAKDAPSKDTQSAQNKDSGGAAGGQRPQQTASAGPGSRSQAREPDRKSAEARAQQANENMKNATKLEDQVAAQGAVVSAMAFVPGFSAYQNSIVPDINQLRMARQYSKPPVDNNRTQRLLGGAQERRWQEMVDSQYQQGN